MTHRPQTVQIFLPFGDSSGVRPARVFVSPRSPSVVEFLRNSFSCAFVFAVEALWVERPANRSAALTRGERVQI